MPPQDLAPVTTSLVPAEPAQLDTITADLPADLDELGRRARWHEGQALLHAYESGRALRRAKGLLPHGAWSEWLEANFPLSHTIACQRLQLVEWVGERKRLLGLLGDVSVKKVRLLMQAPESDVDELVREGTIGGMPLERVKATPHAELQRIIDGLRGKVARLEDEVSVAIDEAEAAKKALAEKAVEAKRGNAATKWIAKIDAVKDIVEKAFTLHFDTLLDECEGDWDKLPPAAQAHLLGLIQYVEARTRLEALSFARALGERPGAKPEDKVQTPEIAKILLADRAAKSAFPLPEGRIPETVTTALERDGLSLARVNPGGLASRSAQPEPVRDITHVLPDGRVISIPKGSALGAEIPAWLEDIDKGLHGPAVETYQLHVNVPAAKARLAVKQVAESLAKGKRNMAPANNPNIDQGDF